MTLSEWGFDGRREELSRLADILGRGRWFFARISGRRRIGKTSLVQQALQPAQRERILYIQIPDSDPAGVEGYGLECLPQAATSRGYLAQDLADLTRGLLP